MTLTRRRFAALASSALAALVLPREMAASRSSKHPSPRPGVTGRNVLTKAQLADHPGVVPLFDDVRRIPHVIDGIRCYCGCTHPPDFYSLLSCFEGEGMARDCLICQGQGRLAVRLHAEGNSLEQIRTAIDAKYG